MSPRSPSPGPRRPCAGGSSRCTCRSRLRSSFRAWGRVDLKLGQNWIIECDSVQFHDNPRQYHLDRARDLQLQARRYTVTRLTWEQVFLDWERTSELLLTILRRREHRRPLAS